MKNTSIILFIFALFTISAMSQAKLEVIGGDTYDWGEITPEQNPLKATVKIKNVGTEILEISKVKPTCGCTTAPLGKDKLVPGESTELDITLRVQQTSGNLHKTIKIYSNDESNKGTYTYHLRATVKRPILVLPKNYIVFDDMTVGFKSTSSVKLKNTSDAPIKLYDFKTTPDNLTINLSKEITLKPNQEIDLIATFVPSKAGNLNARIQMKTNSKEIPAINIQGYGRIKESSLFNSK